MAVPTLNSITPISGPASGGDLVRLVGTGFAARVWVRVGTQLAIVVAVRDEAGVSVVDVRTPAGEQGLADVVLENLDTAGTPIPGESVTLAQAYRFFRTPVAPEADLTRVVRQLLRELKRQVLANVSTTVSVDYDDSPSDGLNIVAMASFTQTGNNPATGAEMRDDLQVWPTRSGRVEPVAGQTARLDWSIPGVQVGYSDLRIGVSKLRTVTRPSTYTETTRESETTAFRLRPDVILVPIQVARFYPGYSGAPDPSVTEIYNERRMRLLLDEQWKPKVLTTSHEGSLKKLVGHWEDWNQDDLHGWTHNYTPDSIFEQCGIQFRMVDYVEVPASQEWWEMTSNGALLCGSLSQGRLRTMRDAAVDAGLRSDLPIVMATRTLMNRGCAEWETVLELACNGSSCGGANWAVFESFHIGGVSQQYVVGHEFGHVVGLADLGPTNPQCSGEKRQLMCQYAALQSARIGDDVPGASCNQARTVAAAYAKRYFTTGGVDF